MEGFFKDDLLERLARLDEDADLLFDDDRRFRMVIVGGSALILLETITRATHDIDALDVSPEIVDLLEKYDINTRAGTFIIISHIITMRDWCRFSSMAEGLTSIRHRWRIL